jgi:FMN-dependent oxidoreductase (nitrilotriacetate monooxygenase family)
MMHLGWFTNFTVGEWTGPFAGDGRPWNGRFYIEMAQALERACFDFLMFEDKLSIPDDYGGSHDVYLKHGLGTAPKGDPAPLVAMIAGATTNLGLVATMSTLAYPPFMLARLASTIDSLSEGRFGWNIVTSAEDSAAQNFGLDALPPREQRYEQADEYLDLVLQLWRSWEPGALVMDRANSIYADGAKVHPINFEGKYFRCRGPLNTAPSPQIVPTLVQAGGSPRGRGFAAKHADAVVAPAGDLASMKAFRDDIRARAAQDGRDPDTIKLLYLIAPVLGATPDEAQRNYDAIIDDQFFIERKLSQMSALTGMDFSRFPLDEPLPGHLTTNGEQGALDAFQQGGAGKTLRQLAKGSVGLAQSESFIGTPDHVADMMGEVMEEIGGDGFLLTASYQSNSRRQIAEICDGLIPALQRRGLARTQYSPGLLRDRLREF